MKRIIVSLLSLLMLFSVPFTVAGASNLTTEQKFDVLKQKNIFTGFADGSSRLYESMSREQLAAILFRLLELPSTLSSPSYDDVLKTRWSYQEIEAVTRAKLMGGTGNKVFSPMQNVTVEQLAAVFVRSYGLSGGGSTPVTGTVSKWARGAVSLALDRKLIPQLSDYTMDASRALLVEAAYAVYEDTHVEPLHVRSVEPLSYQSVRVNLQQWTDNADISRFLLKDNYGNKRSIQQATLSQDGMSVTLWTDRLVGGVTHTLYVDGVGWNYVTIPDDTTKPQVTSMVSNTNRTVEITFSEPVDTSTATNASNYMLNNGLKLTTIQISSDQRKVIFTTSEPVDGKTYQLTIRNVKDLAGNVMDTRSDLYFVGSNDNTKPKVTSVQINANATITVKFSEKIRPEYAVLNDRYSIDKGLSVIQAVIDSDGRTVTLKTSAQQDATLYTLTIANIPDMVGNVMDPSTNWRFGGVANPGSPIVLQSVQPTDRNTLDVTFNRALTDTDVKNFKLTIINEDGTPVAWTDWQSYSRRKWGSDRAVTIQFRNKETNPNLFREGHVYVAKISGVAELVTTNNADRYTFAGTDIINRDPFVSQVIALGRKQIKVMFSEPVKNVDESAFRIREKDGGTVNIDFDELNDTGKVVTEVVLRLVDELQANKTYAMTFQPNIITDAAGWNGLKTSEGSNPYVVYFNGM
ncbi:Ig-like domain-containing protein [Cohnella silvisoli]|uniref:Ig-like domain-containing protein n=1 Tax=Cohnella silvisoli TaxID=2873699 RepID=A0ABV1L028_9BACL|nr:Ig-like domain-containing protein [Cohnella silvisoli]MCD9024884.1 Ig-like domain-containing protein [Cohnella silvisoli]